MKKTVKSAEPAVETATARHRIPMLDRIRQQLDHLGKRTSDTSVIMVNSVPVRVPQGAAFIDSQTYPDSCDATHPFKFYVFIPSSVLSLDYGKLSFFLQAYRRPVAAVNNAAVTSGASSAVTSSSGSTLHHHNWSIGAGSAGTAMLAIGTGGAATVQGSGASGIVDTSTDSATHTHDVPHTHGVTSNVTLTDGIFEGAVATGVTVKINGVDQTSALGGGSGFTTDQTELAIGQWLNIGQLNTIDLTPTGLGRILGHLSITGYRLAR